MNILDLIKLAGQLKGANRALVILGLILARLSASQKAAIRDDFAAVSVAIDTCAAFQPAKAAKAKAIIDQILQAVQP